MFQTLRAIALPTAMTVALSLSGCGGNGLPHSDQVVVTVVPAQATVAVGGIVSLRGSASGFTQTPLVEWWIQEARDAGDSDDCGYLQMPPMSPCQFGYVVFSSVTQYPSSAAYYAPTTPGTYHVTFQASQFETFDHLSKTASATITVTP